MSVTFGFDRKTMEALDELKEDLGVSSEADVLRKAVALLMLAHSVEHEGGKVTIERADGTKSRLQLT